MYTEMIPLKINFCGKGLIPLIGWHPSVDPLRAEQWATGPGAPGPQGGCQGRRLLRSSARGVDLQELLTPLAHELNLAP